ncbi:Lipocalin/cytosolic fatty-acid binding domain, partial [Trinorchestia longiramus]
LVTPRTVGAAVSPYISRRCRRRLTQCDVCLCKENISGSEESRRSESKMVSVVALVLLALGISDAHKLGLGPCQDVTPMQGFDVSKFYGRWYINEVFEAVNTCMTLDFEEKTDNSNEIKASQGRQISPLDAINVKHTTNYAGTIIKGDSETPARMRVKWPVSGIFGSLTYTVVDTDYTNYALTFECASFIGVRYYSASILSRNPQLDPTVMEEIKAKATENGIDVSNFQVVSQQECTKLGEGIDINTDPDDYNLLGLISDDKMQGIKSDDDLIKIFEGNATPKQ